MSELPIETEIKLRVHSARYAVQLLASNGFIVRNARHFEQNVLFDTEDSRLRNAGSAVRLRQAGEESLLTFKGPVSPGPHKTREEIEMQISSFETGQILLQRLGFQPRFRYEKFRTVYQRLGDPGVIVIDETPIGDFIEIEGPGPWIDSTAAKLGFKPTAYVTASYAGLYLEWCRDHGLSPSNMIFATKK